MLARCGHKQQPKGAEVWSYARCNDTQRYCTGEYDWCVGTPVPRWIE
jgi:hypothetical protein